MGIISRLIFQVSQLPPGRQLAVSGLCRRGHHSVPPYSETPIERGALQYSGTTKIVPRQMLGCICHGSPRWHSNYLVGKLRPAQRGAGVSQRRVSSLWPLGSLSRGARTPHFSLSQSPTSSHQHLPAAAPLARLSTPEHPAQRYPVGIPRPQTTPSPTLASGFPPPGRGLLPLVPSYTACALPFAEPVSV